MNRKLVAKYIDHTLLKPDVDLSQIKKLCKEALKYEFYSVCVNPCRVKESARYLKDSSILVCSVVGFPLGANTTAVKLMEIESCLYNGAIEIDMVMNVGLFKEGKYKIVKDEIMRAKKIIGNKTLKIIIETKLLTEKEIVIASKCVEESGAEFIKTSTGFSNGKITPEIIYLIQKSISSITKIKASGGIKTFKQVQEILGAGANRIGTSSGVIIMEEISMT